MHGMIVLSGFYDVLSHAQINAVSLLENRLRRRQFLFPRIIGRVGQMAGDDTTRGDFLPYQLCAMDRCAVDIDAAEAVFRRVVGSFWDSAHPF